jgi:hypothetical protein
MRTDGPEQQTLSVVLQGFSCAHSERGWERVLGLGATGSGRVAWRGRRGMLKTLQYVRWFVAKAIMSRFRTPISSAPSHARSLAYTFSSTGSPNLPDCECRLANQCVGRTA